MPSTIAPPRPHVVCKIESPTHGTRLYTRGQLATALEDIAKAKAKRPTLLVGIVGSREIDRLLPAVVGDDADEVRARLVLDELQRQVQNLCKLHDLPASAAVIVSGGARGFDRLAERFAYWQRLPLIVFPADWDPHDNGLVDKQAGFTRNATIVQVVDELIAWPRLDSDGEPTGGTADSIFKARSSGVPVTLLKG